MKDFIKLLRVRQNNLKDFDINIPLNKFVVITGVSGSGKSSLLYDVIFAEGNRKMLDTFSINVKKHMKQKAKPKAEFITGLKPVFCLSQNRGHSHPRSTVGTITEIENLLRLLMSAIGQPCCPYCGNKTAAKSPEVIADMLLQLSGETEFDVLVHITKRAEESNTEFFDRIRFKGYKRIYINDKFYDLGENVDINNEDCKNVLFVADSINLGNATRLSLIDLLGSAQKAGSGFIKLLFKNKEASAQFDKILCPVHSLYRGEIRQSDLSPNNSDSACSKCGGLGFMKQVNPDFLAENPTKSINKGAFFKYIYNPANLSSPHGRVMQSVTNYYGIDINKSFSELSDEDKDILYYGSGGKEIPLFPLEYGKSFVFSGYVDFIEKFYHNYYIQKEVPAGSTFDEMIKKIMVDVKCNCCDGDKVGKDALLVQMNGKNIAQLCHMPIVKLFSFLQDLGESTGMKRNSISILQEILTHLEVLIELGLGYLSLYQRSESISTGELQRLKLANGLCSGLDDVIYILDEPTSGLHEKDSQAVINIIKKFSSKGNTVLVIEHDLHVIQCADYVIELGPGSGKYGGNITAQGCLHKIINKDTFLTGKYLTGEMKILVPKIRRESSQYIEIKGARANNLKNLNVKIPIGIFVCITGVSGSGKSTLIRDILYKRLAKNCMNERLMPGEHDSIEHMDFIQNIYFVDQEPLWENERSNMSSYMNLTKKICSLMGALPETKEKEYQEKDFGVMDHSKGRCYYCSGKGTVKVSSDYIADISMKCPSCKGKKYIQNILDIRYKEKNIYEIYEMTAREAMEFFSQNKSIQSVLKMLVDMGLEYITLGQPLVTFSGGESQRIKMARQLCKLKNNSMFVLDEPSTGLHLYDLKKLLECFNHIIEKGNSLVVIEHNLNMIKCADYIIDMGPGGGDDGGFIVAEGKPEDICKEKKSETGACLLNYLST